VDTECFVSPTQDQSHRTQSKLGRVFQNVTDTSTNREPAAHVFVVLNHSKRKCSLLCILIRSTGDNFSAKVTRVLFYRPFAENYGSEGK
jgi:hypothetical protein